MAMNEQKTITQNIDADVVVCGAGCAGFSAALASARQGCRTVLLEKTQMIGGTATSGLVGPFMTSYDGTGRRQIVKGLFDEVVTRLENRNGAIHPSRIGDGSPYACYYQGTGMRHNQVTPFRSDLIQLLMLDMVEEAGMDFQINMDVVDVQMDGNRVTGVVVHDGSDWRLYTARIIID